MLTKITILAGSDSVLQGVEYLVMRGMCNALVLPANLKKELKGMRALADQNNLPVVYVDHEDLTGKLVYQLKMLETEAAFVFNFPMLIPKEVYTVPALGCFNFHNSLLPEYRGKDPIFWQIKDQVSMTGISVHQVNEIINSGRILVQYPITIHDQDNYHTLTDRFSNTLIPVIEKTIHKLSSPDMLYLRPQDEGKAKYYDQPGKQDLTINWKLQSAEEIMALIHAAENHGGAIAYMKGETFRIKKVTMVEVPSLPHIIPGMVLHSCSQKGVTVGCINQKHLRLDILMAETQMIEIRNRDCFVSYNENVLDLPVVAAQRTYDRLEIA